MRKPLLKTNRRKRSKRAHSPNGGPIGTAGNAAFSLSSGRKRRNHKVPDLPPNEHLEKHPDEAYGDTEIPERNEEI